MKKKYEVVPYPQINALNILLVGLTYRSPHLHKEIELGIILDGSIILTTGNTKQYLNTGDIYLLNPMELHEIQTNGNRALVIAIQISKQLMSSYFLQSENTLFTEINIRPFFNQSKERYEILNGLCIELAYNYFGQFSNYELKCMSILNMILYILNTYVPKIEYSDVEQTTKVLVQKRLGRITDYVEENFQHKLLLSDIAKRESLTLTYLSHFFKDNMNMSFQEYLNMKRFEYACTLLQKTNKKILAISIESGFSDVRYLNQLCKKYYKCTPLELRKKEQAYYNNNSFEKISSQNFFSSNDSILLLSALREDIQQKFKNYSIQEFYN